MSIAVENNTGELYAGKPTYEELFREAEKYGHVNIYSNNKEPSSNCYHAVIEFNTLGNISLEASSEWGLTIEASLKEAIRQAIKIVSSMPKQKTYDFEYSRRLLANI